MNKLKYLEPIMRFSLLALWILYFSTFEKIPFLFILSILSIDLSIKLLMLLWVKTQIKKNKLIYFNRKKPFFREISDVVGLIILACLIIFVIVGTIEIGTINLNIFGVIYITYIGVYDMLFFKKNNRIYINHYGIVRYGLTESTIQWSKIENFRITQESIDIETSKSSYSIVLTASESEKVADFIKNQQITVHNKELS